jgi:hypothetical protein
MEIGDYLKYISRKNGAYRRYKFQETVLTVPGGKIASNRSTPNIPRFDRVKVPINIRNNYKNMHCSIII